MPHDAVVFIASEYNRYSLAILAGAFETDSRFETLDIYFLNIPGSSVRASHVYSSRVILDLANQHDHVAVAFSFSTASIIDMWKIISELRQTLRQDNVDNVLLIAGGPHPSGDPVGTLFLGIDVVVIGEGEITFPNLLNHYFADIPYDDISGLGFFDAHGHYCFTGHPQPIDLNDFPPFALKYKRFCPMEISRGCPWGCHFCQTSFLMGRRMRHRSIDSIVHYAKVTKQRGLNVLRFISPSAFAYGSADGRTVNLTSLETMLKAVSEIYGKDQVYLGSFPSEVRPEQVTPEALELVKRYCANKNLVIGVQSGSDFLLQAMHRGHGVEEIIRATELTIAAGFVANLDFIFGLPGETPQDCKVTLALMKRLTRKGARIHSHTFMPLVGTPLADSPPGMVEQHIRQWIVQLRGKQIEHGHWKRQEQLAQATAAFLARQKAAKSKCYPPAQDYSGGQL